LKRISIRFALFAVLALVVAACGGDQAEPTATPEAATAEPTREPTEEPTATSTESEAPQETDGADETALADLIPDELNGQPGTPIPGMDELMAGALQQQGVDAEDLEFEFVTYGETENAVVLTAFRIPGMTEVAMETLARSLSGVEAQQDVEAEEVTVAGKSVLRLTPSAGQAGVVYVYFAEDAAFTVVSQDVAAAEQLLAELP